MSSRKAYPEARAVRHSIALPIRCREIPLIASFDRDSDQVEWLQRVARPDDLP